MGWLGSQSRSGAVVLLTLLLVTANAQTIFAARRDSSAVKNILFFGDSLTDGYGLSRSQAYPALLSQKMRDSGFTNFNLINAGVSGDTTAGGLRRIGRYLDHPIEILVLELGINDAFRGVSISEMNENLQGIINRVRAKNPKAEIVVAGMQLPVYGSDTYVTAFGEMFAQLAEKNRAVLLPYLLLGVGGDPALNLADRIHPNAAGQRIVAENVWHVLEPLLRKTTAGAMANVN